MITITTYQIKPFLLIGETPEKYVKPGSEWIRDSIKGLMHDKSEQLKKQGVDTSLFHNHNEANSNTLPGYPKIIYHYTNGQFLVTGINEGAFALQQLFTSYRNMIDINDRLKVGISRFSHEETDIVQTEQPIIYQIHQYLALDSKTHKQYVGVPMTEKIQMIEKTLHKHLINDLFKYMGVSLPNIQVQLVDILKLDQKLLPYKAHFYLPFNLLFSLNANLPQFVALGSGKAFGYGIIEK
jgi:hypothetical protein